MTTVIQMDHTPLIKWKGQTFDQIHSIIKKNSLDSSYVPITDASKFRANPLKLYRREIATQNVEDCNPRTSASIDLYNLPGGTIVNSVSTNSNGLVNVIDNNIPNNKCETTGECVINSPADNARRRVRSGGMVRKKYDASRNTDTYYTNTKQYLASRNSTFEQNQYNYIRKGNAANKPGSSLTSSNVYSANGTNSCKKYFIPEDTLFQYIWIDNTTVDINIPKGYYYPSDINSLLKQTMFNNYHFYMKRTIGHNVDPYDDRITYLIELTFNSEDEKFEIQTFRTDNTIHQDYLYILPADATWTKPTLGNSVYPQIVIPNEIMEKAFGISQTTFPSDRLSTVNTVEVLNSNLLPGIRPNYRVISYKPSNPRFAQQGGVSASDLTARKRYESITNSASVFYNALGQSVGNALSYGVPAGGYAYTVKDKTGYPVKHTPTFSKYSEEMKKCSVTSFANKI